MDIKVKQYKKELAYSYAFGVYPTIELLSYKKNMVMKVLLYTKGEQNSGILEIKKICKQNDIPIEIADRTIEKLTVSKNTYAIGIFKKYTTILDMQLNHVVLVNPGDMGNAGTIIRTMIGFGIDNLVLIKPAIDIFDPKVIRASMGSLFQLKCMYFESFAQYQEVYPRNNYAFITKANQTVSMTTFKQPYALIFGNESSGLGKEYLTVGTSINIPQTAKIDSLSLPVAAGIALYETYQQTL